jgi:leader peptidase (prepilin peptidase)/N-methyltransferase
MRIATVIGCGVAGAIVVAIAVWRCWGTWSLVPFALFAAVGAVLAAIDLATRRLPNRIVLPALAASVAVLLAAALADGVLARWLGAVIGSAALFVLYLVLSFAVPGGMGMGDVKLAALIGLFAGYLGVTVWLLAAVSGFLLGGLVATAGILTRRLELRGAIPFGPWMLAGLWAALAIAGTGPV